MPLQPLCWKGTREKRERRRRPWKPRGRLQKRQRRLRFCQMCTSTSPTNVAGTFRGWGSGPPCQSTAAPAPSLPSLATSTPAPLPWRDTTRPLSDFREDEGGQSPPAIRRSPPLGLPSAGRCRLYKSTMIALGAHSSLHAVAVARPGLPGGGAEDFQGLMLAAQSRLLRGALVPVTRFPPAALPWIPVLKSHGGTHCPDTQAILRSVVGKLGCRSVCPTVFLFDATLSTAGKTRRACWEFRAWPVVGGCCGGLGQPWP
mmetsp:Transcript_56244/g.137951  ORF Transcript_56244/g.137951 Transcript_56244/m.137951 type:complete len:258 (+) Transcript_56244:2029-2802(+)